MSFSCFNFLDEHKNHCPYSLYIGGQTLVVQIYLALKVQEKIDFKRIVKFKLVQLPPEWNISVRKPMIQNIHTKEASAQLSIAAIANCVCII